MAFGFKDKSEALERRIEALEAEKEELSAKLASLEARFAMLNDVFAKIMADGVSERKESKSEEKDTDFYPNEDFNGGSGK